MADPVPFIPVDPKGISTGKTTFAPFIFGSRPDLWQTVFGPNIDDTSSDPYTLSLLSTLLAFQNPQIIVEVGTYRGWGTATLAETLRVYDLPSHLWSCDPVDHGVQQMLDQAELSTRVTLFQGTFEGMLSEAGEGKMDFCYIDGGSRLPYTKLALKHMNPGGLIAVDDCAGEWRGAKMLRRMANLYLPTHRGLALIKT